MCFNIKKLGGICHTVEGDGATDGTIKENFHTVRWISSATWSDTIMPAGTALTLAAQGLSLSPAANNLTSRTSMALKDKTIKATWY